MSYRTTGHNTHTHTSSPCSFLTTCWAVRVSVDDMARHNTYMYRTKSILQATCTQHWQLSLTPTLRLIHKGVVACRSASASKVSYLHHDITAKWEGHLLRNVWILLSTCTCSSFYEGRLQSRQERTRFTRAGLGKRE